MVMMILCRAAKETQMWEKVRVGCSKRIALRHEYYSM